MWPVLWLISCLLTPHPYRGYGLAGKVPEYSLPCAFFLRRDALPARKMRVGQGVVQALFNASQEAGNIVQGT
jgi:hypothetical protein